ncbi:hypothetical protein FAUST_1868 [Fusarium austroamericanum]|uniref:Uncharacterized protein n=1 Tax=Fusarium austroamericanum TaxID=282268 RepID=A0AAN6HJ79_FUSAU|nr:hypothetical protein FAUST_1868 [Fusarium austroamericanum]
MPSKTDVSDVSSANATHGSATPPPDKDTKTPSNGPARSHYPIAETEDEKKKRRDELLIGVGSHLNKGVNSQSTRHAELAHQGRQRKSAESPRGETKDKNNERQDELLIGIGSLLNIAETKAEKKKRQDELLIGIGSHFKKVYIPNKLLFDPGTIKMLKFNYKGLFTAISTDEVPTLNPASCVLASALV